MTLLTELLTEHRQEISRLLYLGYVRWDNLVRKLESQERTRRGAFGDEQVWTFLVGCGYAMADAGGVAKLTKVITGVDLPQPDDSRIWQEVLPLPPSITTTVGMVV